MMVLVFHVLLLFVTLSAPAVLRAQLNNGGDEAGADPWHELEFNDELGTGAESPAAILRAIRSELALGRGHRALVLLSEYPLPDSLFEGAPVEAFAEAMYLQGEYEQAAQHFFRAAAFATGRRRGVLTVRSGEAAERAGAIVEARDAYRRAAASLPRLRGWLAFRVARVTPDTAAALRWLAAVPSEAAALAGTVRAEVFEAAGDSVRAAEAWLAANRFDRAAAIRLANGDSVSARPLAYRAIGVRSAEQALAGAQMVLDAFPPEGREESHAVARTLLRYGRPDDAVTILKRAIAIGDSSTGTLGLLGDASANAGDRWGALRYYRAAADGGGEGAGEAEYKWARQLVRMGRRTAARQALSTFASNYPAHPRTPAAFYLLGDSYEDADELTSADSVYQLMVQAWPDNSFTSQARFRMATHALGRADTATAVRWLREESRADGENARPARFQLARILQRQGDSVAAVGEWRALARSDSLGYYGTIAREAAGLAPPDFAPVPAFRRSRRIGLTLNTLDQLDEVRFAAEADALIDAMLESDNVTPAELLEFAEGLNERGRTTQAIRLGWRLTRQFTLNNPRVLRVIFPWPRRDLIEREAAKFGVDPYLVAALVRQESAFDANATSRAGARGMMQLMPPTARGVARRGGVEYSSDLLGVADANIHLGTSHLAALLRQYDGEIRYVLAAYNAGGRRVAQWRRFPESDDLFVFVERIPFRETKGYVRTVMRNRELYAALYNQPHDLIP